MFKLEKSSIVLILSFLPGLSHFYLGRRKKAIVLFIIDLGVFSTLLFSQSYLMKLLMINVYIVTFLPVSLETYHLAKGSKSRINTDSRWYVTVLLITTGFNAIPLLWQNEKLTKRFKVIWTILVPVFAFTFFFILVSHWEKLEGYLRGMLNNFN